MIMGTLMDPTCKRVANTSKGGIGASSHSSVASQQKLKEN